MHNTFKYFANISTSPHSNYLTLQNNSNQNFLLLFLLFQLFKDSLAVFVDALVCEVF